MTKPNPSKLGKDELNEFQAAALVGMSPKLIRWFASYAAKAGSKRKLKVRKVDGGIHVDRETLLEFNDWLQLPWPSQDNARPTVPSGIKREIREEAGGDCAICHGHAESCEAAHIDPVATSKNNHPANLIWLCANHHTKFDKHTWGPSEDCVDFVVGFKQNMTYFRRAVWQLQAEVTGGLYSILKTCEGLDAQLKAAATPAQKTAVEALAKKAIKQVPKMAPTSKSDPDYPAFIALKAEFDALSKSSTKPKDIGATLSFAAKVKADFAHRAGYVECPLCKGGRSYRGEDCPACGGEGEMPEARAGAVDLTRYEVVDCPLCKAAGTFEGRDCPVCQGDRRIELRFAQQVDPTEWDEVDCPRCKGKGTVNGEDCPVCGGERTMEKNIAERIDLDDFKLVDCPLCKGNGVFLSDDCPACHGERQMERRQVEQVDVDSYKLVKCPICKGGGEHEGSSCRACGGEGEMMQGQVEDVDRRDYDMVPCPSCKGKSRDFCRTCNDEGRLPRWAVDRL